MRNSFRYISMLLIFASSAFSAVMQVNSAKPEGVTSSFYLLYAQKYLVIVTGTFCFRSSDRSEADALYYNDKQSPVNPGCDWSYSDLYYHLQFSLDGTTWQDIPRDSYNKNHMYGFFLETLSIDPLKISFRITDYPEYYSDNIGSLEIAILGYVYTPSNEKKSASTTNTATGDTDPVHLKTGEFYHETTDISIPGQAFAINLGRTYRSNSQYYSRYGLGWDMSCNLRVKSFSANKLILLNGHANKREYLQSTDMNYYCEDVPGEYLQMRSEGGYVLYRRGGEQHVFDQNGCIIQSKDRFGNSLNYEYEQDELLNNKLIPIKCADHRYRTDSPTVEKIIAMDYQLTRIIMKTARSDSEIIERILEFNYNNQGLLDNIVDIADPAVSTDDRMWQYQYYNYNNELKCILLPEEYHHYISSEGTLKECLKTTYTYRNSNIACDNSDFYGQLEKIYDAANDPLEALDPIPYIELSYEGNGKVQYQTYGEGNGIHGDGIGEFEINYAISATAGQEVTRVVDREGGVADNIYDSEGREIQKVIYTPSSVEERLRGIDDPAYYYTPKYEYYPTTCAEGIKGQIKSVTYPKEYPTINSPEFVEGRSIFYTYYTTPDKDSPVYGQVHTVTEKPVPGTENNVSIATSYTYEPDYGSVSSITTPRGQISFTYTNYLLTKITYPAVPIAVFENNTLSESIACPEINYTYYTEPEVSPGATIYGKLKTMQASGGPIIQYTYYPDNAGVGSIGRLHTVEIDPGHLYHSVAEDLITTYEYDVYGNVKKIIHPDSSDKEFLFNKLDQLVQITSEENITTYLGYNENKKLCEQYTGGKQIRYIYDLLDQLTIIRDWNLLRDTETQYTLNGQVESVEDPQPKIQTSSNDEDVKYIYDERGLVWKVTDAHNESTCYWYDATGNMTKIQDSENQITQYTYDGYGRLASVCYPPNENNVSTYEYFRYDTLGNLIQKTKRSSDQYHYFYDTLGHVVSDAHDDNNNSIITMDNGDVGTSSTGIWSSCSDVADAYNENYAYTTQSGATYTYQPTSQLDGYYTILMHWPVESSASANVTVQVLENGNVKNDILHIGSNPAVSFAVNQQLNGGQWNSVGTFCFTTGTVQIKLIANNSSKTIADAVKLVPATRYMYDAGGRLFQVIRSTDQIANRYDGLGRLTSISTTDQYTRLVGYNYDNYGRWMEVVYPDTTVVKYALDAMGRTTDIYYNGNINKAIAHYSYDDLSRRTIVKYGYVNETTYDASIEYDYEDARTVGDNMGNNLKEIINRIGTTVIASYSYTYDNAGNRKTQSGTYDSFTYNYDDLYRLDNGYQNAVYFNFNYDSLGNRIEAITDYHWYYSIVNNQLNQYTTVGTYNNPISMSYDTNGNMTYDGNFTYTYDSENRLKQAINSQNVVIAEYSYDALGRRITKTTFSPSTSTIQFVYNGADIIAEYANGSLTRKYIYGPGIDDPICMIDATTSSNNEYYYHYDGLGSVVALSNNGIVVERYRYDTFGRTKVCDSSGNQRSQNVSWFGNRFMFTGREYDDETNLYYYRARMYSPALGRFMQPDPIGYADGMNPYQYCGNNPVNIIDSFGLCGSIYSTKEPSWGQELDWFLKDTVGWGALKYYAWNAYNAVIGPAHVALDMFGVVDQTGFADGINAGIYALEGDRYNASCSSAAAAPGIGAAVAVSKYGPKVAAALKRIPHVEGVYEFVAKSGKKYIGQSKDLYNRIMTHLRNEKIKPGDVGSIKTTQMPGSSSVERRVFEQQKINDFGGVGPTSPLENQRNSVKISDWPQHGVKP